MSGWLEARGIPTPAQLVGRPHGTRHRYMSGCRCTPCRAANSRYECERAAARRRGEGAQLVPADRARAHILKLGRLGVGYKSVAAAASVAVSVCAKIRSGERRQIRATTERRIVAVDAGARADSSLVPARATWRRIEALRAEGFSKREIARRLGLRGNGIQFGRGRILARTEARVERFYRLMVEEPPA